MGVYKDDMQERYTSYKQGVTGSNPVSPTSIAIALAETIIGNKALQIISEGFFVFRNFLPIQLIFYFLVHR